MSEWQERLVEAIGARGITGGELARRAGFSAQYINSLRSKERGARLPLDTARRLAQALGVSVDWLTSGTGPRERLSDTYPIYGEGSPDSIALSDRYPSRAEAVALLATTVEPEVIAALRAVVADPADVDPGREHWIDRARELAADLRRIKADPVFTGAKAQTPPARSAPKSGAAPKSQAAPRSAPAPKSQAAPRSAPAPKSQAAHRRTRKTEP